MKPRNPGGRPMKFNEKDVEVVKAMFANGLEVSEIEIAFDYGISQATIRNYTKGIVAHKEKKKEYLRGLRTLFESWTDEPLEKFLGKEFAKLIEEK